MKFLLSLSAIAVALSAASASAAPTIDFHPGSGVLPANVDIIENFDEYAVNTTDGTGAYTLNTSSSSGAIPAFGSTGNYASVLRGGSYSLTFAPASTLAFVLGSLDAYNTLELFFSDDTSITYEGSAIIGVNPPPYADGNQAADYTNGVVSYSVGAGPKIVGAEFDSGANSFEFDNIAVSSATSLSSAAPEPAAWAFMILGMGAVGAMLRRQRVAAATAAA
jgi:hypothetical protein